MGIGTPPVAGRRVTETPATAVGLAAGAGVTGAVTDTPATAAGAAVVVVVVVDGDDELDEGLDDGLLGVLGDWVLVKVQVSLRPVVLLKVIVAVLPDVDCEPFPLQLRPVRLNPFTLPSATVNVPLPRPAKVLLLLPDTPVRLKFARPVPVVVNEKLTFKPDGTVFLTTVIVLPAAVFVNVQVSLWLPAPLKVIVALLPEVELEPPPVQVSPVRLNPLTLPSVTVKVPLPKLLKVLLLLPDTPVRLKSDSPVPVVENGKLTFRPAGTVFLTMVMVLEVGATGAWHSGTQKTLLFSLSPAAFCASTLTWA
jgi:hypothetical protein